MSKNILIGWSNKKAQYQCQSNLCDQYNRVIFFAYKKHSIQTNSNQIQVAKSVFNLWIHTVTKGSGQGN